MLTFWNNWSFLCFIVFPFIRATSLYLCHRILHVHLFFSLLPSFVHRFLFFLLHCASTVLACSAENGRRETTFNSLPVQFWCSIEWRQGNTTSHRSEWNLFNVCNQTDTISPSPGAFLYISEAPHQILSCHLLYSPSLITACIEFYTNDLDFFPFPPLISMVWWVDMQWLTLFTICFCIWTSSSCLLFFILIGKSFTNIFLYQIVIIKFVPFFIFFIRIGKIIL